MQASYTTPRSHHVIAVTLALLLSGASASVFAGWFGNDKVKGNGVVKTQERTLGHFTGVALSLPAKVEVRIGNVESVVIEADENILPLIGSTIEDGSLQLRVSQRNVNLEAKTLKIIVNAKEITDLGIGGSGSITAESLRSPQLHLAIGGGGSIEVKQVQSDALEAAIGGSGNIKLGGGTARKFSVSIGGSGDVRARTLKADDVSVSIGGSGSAALWATTSLQTSIAGSGDVTYFGDPKTSSSVVGSGSIKRMGAAPQ
ncbi:MAG: DUF2807 domain-containing protein [Ramlibacter sp.]|nr:DUF2807 domain-containing protein [Ramlibacter sp.]